MLPSAHQLSTSSTPFGAPFSVGEKRLVSLVEACDRLIGQRSAFGGGAGGSAAAAAEEYARNVIVTLFDEQPFDLLRVRAADEECVLDRVVALVGFESPTFATIYNSDVLLNEFSAALCRHTAHSGASEGEARDSVLMWLVADYLAYILPLDEGRMHALRDSSWIGRDALSAALPASAATTPRKLLRPEVLAASFPMEQSLFKFDAYKTLYPRLLQFVGLFISHLVSMKLHWPKPVQLFVLRFVLNHYNRFLMKDESGAGEGAEELASLRLLLARKPMYVDGLRLFLERLFKNWPFDYRFDACLELWLCLIWNHQAFGGSLSEEKYHFFMQASAKHFIGLFDVLIQRVLRADCGSLLDNQIFEMLLDNVFKDQIICKAFYACAVGPSPVDYLRELFALLNGTLAEQRREQAKTQSLPWSARLLALFGLLPGVGGGPRPLDIPHLKHLMGEIQRLLTQLDGTGSRRDLAPGRSPSPRRSSSPLNPGTPDHVTDPATKMLCLTPTGRAQVLNRRARFDFAAYSKQIRDTFPGANEWEFGVLARFLHRLSLALSPDFAAGMIAYLRRRETFVSRNLAKVLLCGPSPPRYVPVFAKMVPRHPHHLNMRPLAGIPFLVAVFSFFLLIIWWLWF